jgi:hypothetical protein
MTAWSLIYLLAVIGIRTFQTGVFEDVYRDDIFTAAMYGFFKAFLLSWISKEIRSVP